MGRVGEGGSGLERVGAAQNSRVFGRAGGGGLMNSDMGSSGWPRCDEAGSWLKRAEAVLRGRIGVVAGSGTMRLVRGLRRRRRVGAGGGMKVELVWCRSGRWRDDVVGHGSDEVVAVHQAWVGTRQDLYRSGQRHDESGIGAEQVGA